MNTPMEATILTVDDDPVNRKIIEQALKRDGYRVVEADSGSKRSRSCARSGRI